MTDTFSPNLTLPYLAPGQAQKHVTVNEAIRRLDALVQARVLSRRAAPPEAPAEGDCHIVAAPATGAFIGEDGNLAAFQDGGWVFLSPRPGWRVWSLAERTLLIYDGGVWVPAGPERLSAARTYHVSPAGTDTADGLTPSTAFLTVQRAIDAAGALDCAGQAVTIQLADGTYEGAVALARPLSGAARLVISGNPTSPASVILSHTSNLVSVTGGARLMITGVRLTTHTVWGSCLYASEGGVIDVGRVVFGPAVRMQIEVAGAAKVNLAEDYSIAGGAIRHFSVTGSGAFIEGANRTLTLTGSPAFSEAFAGAFGCGGVLLFNVAYSGSATGARYLATFNGTIQVFGGAALPGNAAGALATGGQYG